jgi:hypothetical protein
MEVWRTGEHVTAVLDRMAAHLTTGQAVALSGAGSAAAISAALGVDPSWAAWLRIATFAIGLLSGLGGLILVTMKAIQQRREMRAWARKNPW